ncbi:hypothetical protein GCM10020370_17620 [Paenibacillus hodogayensis]
MLNSPILGSGDDGSVDVLHPDFIRWACDTARLPDDAAAAVAEGAAVVRAEPEQADRVRQFHRELFVEKTAPRETNERLLKAGPQAGMLAALVYLGGIPQMIEVYKAKGIPERILTDTLGDITIWMRRYYSEHGTWGLDQANWLYTHLTGQLFRLGRLQFHFMAYNRPFKVFRNRASGEVLGLSEAGVRYRADGKADGTNGISDPAGEWTSSLDEDGSAYTGHPVLPGAVAGRTAVTVSLRDWELVLERGNTVLNVHIPEGSKMSHELCRDSYGQAVEFFAAFFPEKPFLAFVCSSWLLAPQWPVLLPAEANIVRFQSDYCVTPGAYDELQTLERVFGFGTKLADLPNVPRETSLQRIVFDHLAAGKVIHGAAGFLLRDDWEKGTSPSPQASMPSDRT